MSFKPEWRPAQCKIANLYRIWTRAKNPVPVAHPGLTGRAAVSGMRGRRLL